jgi:cytoskeletal protein RodZ
LAGEILKKRREDLGLDIREIADLLKIKAAYLVAIENDTFAELPAPVYTTGYIRSYAKYLDVDSESIVLYYTKNLSQPGYTTIIPIAVSKRKSPKIYYVLPLLVCASAVFFFAAHAWTTRNDKAKAPLLSAQVVKTVRPSVSKPPEDNRAPAAAKGTTGLLANEEHNLQIAATETTWISVRYSDGRSEEMLLRPGNARDLSFSGKVLLKVGNAGGINVRMDEKDLGAPGVPGQVISMSLPAE